MSAPEEIEVYVTKYALTKRGVIKVKGIVFADSVEDTRPRFQPERGWGLNYLVYHGDWHVTEAAAAQRVKQMVAAQRKAELRKANRLTDIESLLRRGQLPMAKGT